MDAQVLTALQTVMSGGPALIFAVMWWLERKERLDLSKKLIDTLMNMGSLNDAWLKVLNHPGRGK